MNGSNSHGHVRGLSVVLLGLVAATSSALGAGSVFTTNKTGDWDAADTWGFSPGVGSCHTTKPCMPQGAETAIDGDRVVIAAGHTLTCSTTCSAGNAPADDSTSVAIGTSSSSAVLVVSGTLTYASSVRQSTSNWTIAAGATIKYDSSYSSAPTTAKYTWDIPNGGRLTYNGSSGSHVTWIGANNAASNGSCNSNACRSGRVGTSASTSSTDAGATTASYVDFSYLGDTTVSDFHEGFSIIIVNSNSTMSHCTFTFSNFVQIRESGTNGTGNLTVEGLIITDSIANASGFGGLHIITKASLGTRVIRYSYLKGFVSFGQGASNYATNLTMNSMLFEHETAVTFGLGGGQGVQTSDVNTDQIMVYNDSTTDRYSGSPGGVHTRWHMSRMENSAGTAPHSFFPGYGQGTTFDGLVVEGNSPGNNADFLSPPANSAAAAVFTVRYSIFTCRADGLPIGSSINHESGATANVTIDHYNNTLCTAFVGSPPGAPSTDNNVMGIGWESSDDSPNVAAGAFRFIGNNIFFRLDAVGNVYNCGGPAANPAGIVHVAGWNAFYNKTLGAVGYCTHWTTNGHVTSGPQNDQEFARSPNFVAPNRRLLTFDVAYLGHAVGTAWASGQSYHVGDVLSDNQSTVYNTAINWRCISDHTSSSANRPYTGSAWVDKWQPAALQDIKTSVLAGELFTDATINATNVTMIGLLNLWMRAGYKPTGVDAGLLTGTGRGGSYPTYVGAMDPGIIFPFPMPGGVSH